ncbi:MAG: hypothetical protein IKK72_06705 [Oscillospiraceae bacterium]|nr:hypothetical protein [Oscillospiraceae bacterium]
MGMFMASLSFRCPDQNKWQNLKPRLEKVCAEIPGLVTNMDSSGPGYVLLSPYGDLGPALGELVEQISALTGDYAVMAMCVDSDFNMMELYHGGKLLERSCIGECYYDLPEEMAVAAPDIENWKPLLIKPEQMEALSEALFGEEVFAEDNLRKLSALTGLPIFDDELMFE